jgi:HK97 family phage prohead protease
MIERLACGMMELKFDPSSEVAMKFTGYGAVFGNVDAYGDVIIPGAFADTIASARKSGLWPAMLSQHGGWGMSADDLTPVGVWTDLAEDGKGLRVEGKFADTPRGIELYKLMKMEPRPAINGLSIGYIPKEWTARSKPDEPRRTLKKIDLIEISPVTFPANGKARVQSVKAIEELQKLGDVERFLRDAGGLSRSEAVALVSRIKSLGQGDPDGGGVDELAALVKQGTEILQS